MEHFPPYDGEINAQWQSCIESEGSQSSSGKIYVSIDTEGLQELSQKVQNGSMTSQDMLEDMGTPFVYSFQNTQLHWSWNGAENKYTFFTYPGKESLWKCYFEMQSPFFQVLFDKDTLEYGEGSIAEEFSPILTQVTTETITSESDPLRAFINPASLKIQWSVQGDSADNPHTYILRYGTSNTDLTKKIVLKSGEWDVFLSHLDESTQYFFQIESSHGLKSEVQSFTTP